VANRGNNMMDTLITGKFVLTDPFGDPLLKTDTGILVSGDKIVHVGDARELIAQSQANDHKLEKFDLVIPGLINSHHHSWAFSPLQLGCLDDSLEPWLLELGRVPDLDPRLTTMFSSVRQLKSGVTTLIHSDGPGSADTYESLLRERLSGYASTGQRVAFSVGYTDQNNFVYAPDTNFLAGLPAELDREARAYLTATKGLDPAEYMAMFSRTEQWVRTEAAGRLRILAGPLSPIWCSQAALEMMGQICNEFHTGLHTHLAESVYQRHYAQSILGGSLVAYLNRLGLLGPNSSFAHSVWVTREDMQLLAEAGATVVHNPASNLRLRSGIAPVLLMRSLGVSVALGQDATALGDDDDFLEEIRLASKLHFRPGDFHDYLSLSNVLQMIYAGGRRASLWGAQIGSLTPGTYADIVGISLDRLSLPSAASTADLMTMIFQRLRSSDVRWVMVGGQVVVEGGECVTCREEDLRHELSEQASKRHSELSPMTSFIARLRPYITHFYEEQRVEHSSAYYVYNGE
jgi:5-methylthioadenosine/S-adenosylhomocysteine deaminase